MKTRAAKKRKLQSWTDLSDLENRHAGRKCFVVGAGPSIGFLDLSGIHKHVVIAINSSILLLPWQDGNEDGRYWISNDTLCMRWSYFWTHVLRARCTKIVRTSWRSHDEKLRGHGFRYFTPRRSQTNHLGTEDAGLCSVSSVPSGIDLAIRLGCSQIYLLGVDQKMVQAKSHFWQFWPKDKQPTRRDKGKGFQPEQKHQIKVFNHNKKVFKALKQYAEDKRVEIKNCSSRSALDTFDKVSLDQALL